MEFIWIWDHPIFKHPILSFAGRNTETNKWMVAMYQLHQWGYNIFMLIEKTPGRRNNHISMRLVKKYETYIINISGVSRLSSLVVSSSYFFTSRLIKTLPVPPKCPALIQGSQKCLHSHAASHSRPCYLDSTRSGEWWWMKFSYAIVG